MLRVLYAAGLSESDLVEICRQTIRRLLDSGQTRRLEALRPNVSLERLIARWTSDPAYLERGEPRRLRVRGNRPSFTSLVRAVSPKSSVTSALTLLNRRGLVSINRRGQVRLLARFYPVRARDAVDLELFTTMTIDFLRTHEFNFLKNPRRGHGLFQRIAHKRYADATNRALNSIATFESTDNCFLKRADDWLGRHRARASTLGCEGKCGWAWGFTLSTKRCADARWEATRETASWHACERLLPPLIAHLAAPMGLAPPTSMSLRKSVFVRSGSEPCGRLGLQTSQPVANSNCHRADQVGGGSVAEAFPREHVRREWHVTSGGPRPSEGGIVIQSS